MALARVVLALVLTVSAGFIVGLVQAASYNRLQGQEELALLPFAASSAIGFIVLHVLFMAQMRFSK